MECKNSCYRKAQIFLIEWRTAAAVGALPRTYPEFYSKTKWLNTELSGHCLPVVRSLIKIISRFRVE